MLRGFLKKRICDPKYYMFKIFDYPFGKVFIYFQYAKTFSYDSIYFLQFMVIWYLGLKA
jgi:hypothetical protein